MARTLYGPGVVTTPNTSGDGDLRAYTGVLTAWTAEVGGRQITDLQTPAGSAIPQVTPDATTGRYEFLGEDGYGDAIWLEASTAVGAPRWREWPADLAGRAAPTWTTLIGKPAVVAAGADAATARAAISAGVDTVMTSAEATAGTDTNPRQITAAVLKAGAQAAAASTSNTYTMPLWDGTGTQPVRPTTVPAGTVVVWRQPTAPPLGSPYAIAGVDRWANT